MRHANVDLRQASDGQIFRQIKHMPDRIDPFTGLTVTGENGAAIAGRSPDEIEIIAGRNRGRRQVGCPTSFCKEINGNTGHVDGYADHGPLTESLGMEVGKRRTPIDVDVVFGNSFCQTLILHRGRQPELQFTDPDGFQVRGHWWIVKYDEVQGAVHDFSHQFLGGMSFCLDLDFRRLGPDLDKLLLQREQPDSRGRAKINTGIYLRPQLHFLNSPRPGRNHGFGMRKQSLAFLGKLQVASLPDEQLNAEQILKLLDPRGHGSRSDKKVVRCPGEVARPIDLDKCFQQIYVHGDAPASLSAGDVTFFCFRIKFILLYGGHTIPRMRALSDRFTEEQKTVARSIKLLLVSMGVLLTGHGLQLTLLPMHARSIGWSDTEIGLTAAAYFLGFVLGCLSVPRLLTRAGHIRVFLTVAGITAASLLLLEAWQWLPVWILLRLLNGWCLAAIYSTTESWLNEHALDHQRARLIAFYVLVSLVSIAAGQIIFGLLPTEQLFTGAATIMMISLVPVGLFCTDQPMALKQKRIRARSVFLLPAVARAGSFLSGVVTGSLWTMAPLVAEGNGLSAASVSYVMTAVVVGGAVFQLPLGYAADRIGRARTISVAAIGCLIVAAVSLQVAPTSTLHLMVTMFLFGGTSLSLYALSAAEANAECDLSRVEIATLFLLMNGAGSMAGPILTGLLSNWTDAALYIVGAGSMAVLLVYSLADTLTSLTLPYPRRLQTMRTEQQVSRSSY